MDGLNGFDGFVLFFAFSESLGVPVVEETSLGGLGRPLELGGLPARVPRLQHQVRGVVRFGGAHHDPGRPNQQTTCE